MQDTYCPIPWIFQAVRSNGDLRVCCQANISAGQGVLRDEQGRSHNARNGDLDSPRNSELLKQMRLSMLNGEWSSSCERCRREEAAGLTSRRSYERAQWTLSYEEARQKTNQHGEIDTEKSPVIYYDLRFGNLCNLKCRMCGPTDSSAWYEDWVELTGESKFKDTSGKVVLESQGDRWVTSAYDWHYDERFWQSLANKLHNIHHVYMAGGEPLLIKKHYEFLRQCVERDCAKNIVLEYNTNCTKLPTQVLELWKSFKNVRIGASIDGYGDMAEYQRYPCRWDEVYQNLQILNQQPKHIDLWLAYTVTIYNVFHLADFIKWKITESGLDRFNGTLRRPLVTYHMAHNPHHLNVRNLPLPLKKLAQESLQELVLWVQQKGLPEHYLHQAQNMQQSICSYMFKEDYTTVHWKTFTKYTQKLDQMRGQSVFSFIPQMKEYFEC